MFLGVCAASLAILRSEVCRGSAPLMPDTFPELLAPFLGPEGTCLSVSLSLAFI